MCHVKPDIEIGVCEHCSPLIAPPGLGLCADDSSVVFRRRFRLLFELLCEKLGVLSVERPMCRCGGFIAEDARS